jgi:hypothetical protein
MNKNRFLPWLATVVTLAAILGVLVWAVQRRGTTSPRAPVVKPHELSGYELEVVSVRVRLKRLEIEREGRTPPYRVSAHVALEDHTTGVIQLHEMTNEEFARYTSEFPTGQWYTATGMCTGGNPPHIFLGGSLSR